LLYIILLIQFIIQGNSATKEFGEEAKSVITKSYPHSSFRISNSGPSVCTFAAGKYWIDLWGLCNCYCWGQDAFGGFSWPSKEFLECWTL